VFIYLESVQRSEDGCDMRRFRNITCKTVSNLLQVIYLRHNTRVTVVKFGVDYGGSDGTSCFRIQVRTDIEELTDMRM